MRADAAGHFSQREPDGVAEVCVATVPQGLHAPVRLAATRSPAATIRVIESDASDGELASADLRLLRRRPSGMP
nr:hypothetical protein [Sinorhizobium meliloti]